MSIFEDRVFDRLAELPKRKIPAGEVLIAEDSSFDSVYFLKSGTVSVSKGGVAIAEVSSLGAVFGEMSHFLERPSSATVTAVTDVVIYEAEEPGLFFVQNPHVLIYIARILSRRIDDLNQRMAEQLSGSDDPGQLRLFEEMAASLVQHDPDALTRDAELGDE